MSSWITNSLKTLRSRVGNVGSISQPRSPPHYGAQVKEVSVPVRPKKPLSPYFRFMGQVRPVVHKENPSVKIKDLMKMIAQRWERLDEAAKNTYITAYKSEMEGYSTIIEKYRNSLTPAQKEAQLQAKLEKQLQKEKRGKRKRLRDLDKPKKPASAFFRYLASKVDRGSSITEYKETAKKLSETWKTLSDADKAPFMSKYQQDLQLYEKNLISWEDKMLKQGNDDLVRESRRVPTKSK